LFLFSALYALLKPVQHFRLDPAHPALAELNPLGERSGRFEAGYMLRGIEDKLLELTLRQYPHRGSPRERSIAMPRGLVPTGQTNAMGGLGRRVVPKCPIFMAAHSCAFLRRPENAARLQRPPPALQQAMQRRSRMMRTKTGKRIELTERDLEIFRLLQRYRYLRSTYIHAFVGGASETRLKERLGDLFHEGYLERPEKQWQFADGRHAPAVYERGSRAELAGLHGGQAIILGAGAPRQFQHAVMICEVLASIELACREPARPRFIPWSEIREKAPVPLLQIGQGVRPDALFGLEYQVGGRRLYRFLVLEVDRGTMPVTRTDARQTSVAGKLAAYQGAIRQDRHKTDLGLPNLMTLFVTLDAIRAAAIAGLPWEASAAPAVFVRSVEPGELKRPLPTLLTAPWRRLGGLPLALSSAE
jgi:hypothetical protein